MKFLDIIKTVQSNLLRAKVRTILTVLAVLIGTLTLQLTTAMSEGARSYITTQIHATAQPNTLFITLKSPEQNSNPNTVPEYKQNNNNQLKGIRQTMSTSDVNKIKTFPNITNAFADYSVGANYIQYGNGKKYILQLQSLYPDMQNTLAAGKMFNPTDTTKIMLPYIYVSTLGFNSPQDLIGKQVLVQIPFIDPSTKQIVPNKTKNITLTVAGVTTETIHEQGSFISYVLMKELVEYQYQNSPSFNDILATTTPNLRDAQIKQLKQILSDNGYTGVTYADQIARFNQTLNIVQLGLSLFAIVALLAAGLGIINTLLMSVLERTQEIGLMKALGMKRRGIFMIFSFEAISIGFWGGIVGLILAILLSLLINHLATKFFLQNAQGYTLLIFNPLSTALIVIGAMILGFLAGVIPAVRAAKLDPIEALRHE